MLEGPKLLFSILDGGDGANDNEEANVQVVFIKKKRFCVI